jgi:hypothetical protein
MKRTRIKLLLGSAVVIIIVLGAIVAFRCHCPSGVYSVSVGDYPSLDIGNRASMRQLALAIKKCPTARSYSVHWTVKAEHAERATGYSRDDHLLGYEVDPGSGYADEWNNVTDDSIFSTAAQGGTFGDLLTYGATHRLH